jgi:hypothetical protein
MSGKHSGSGLMEQVRSFQRYHGWRVMRYRDAVIIYFLPQDLLTLDVTKLTPLSPEVISRQATINIGMSPERFLALKHLPCLP